MLINGNYVREYAFFNKFNAYHILFCSANRWLNIILPNEFNAQ
jgi:hypothetical protein